MPTDFYDVLGAPADASSEELKRAYRGRVREYHPDVNDHPEGDAQFKLVRKAHDVLSDPAERKDYDRMGHREYVDRRLDDLPPLSVFPELEDAAPKDSDSSTSESGPDSSSNDTSGRATSESRSTSRDASTSSSRSSAASQSTGTEASGKSQSASASRSSESATSTEQGRSTRSDRSTGHRTTSSSRSTGSTGSTDSTQSTSTRSTDNQTTTAGRANGGTSAGAERSSWDDVTERTARSSATQSSTASRRRRGLRRWYGVVLLSLLAYLAGLGTYAAPYAEALSGLANGLTTAPVPTLIGTFPLPSPTAYVLGAVNTAAAGQPSAGLLFLVGAVALPLVVLTAVAQFGQGSAWIYALASLGPAVPLAVAVVAPLPTALALVGLVVLPLFSGLGFLVDVGRYLYATR